MLADPSLGPILSGRTASDLKILLAGITAGNRLYSDVLHLDGDGVSGSLQGLFPLSSLIIPAGWAALCWEHLNG